MKNQIAIEKPMTNPAGNHLCLIYNDDPQEQIPALAPYIGEAMRIGERFIYIADDFSPAELSLALKMNGIDAEAEIERGALKIWSRDEWITLGAIDSPLRAENLSRVIQEAMDDGFKGIRFAVEMTWTLGSDEIDAEKLERWEARINSIFTPDLPAKILCQYNRRKLPPSFVGQAFRTHPFAVVGDCPCGNPFYKHPSVTDDGSEIEWRLARLKEIYSESAKNGDYNGETGFQDSPESSDDWRGLSRAEETVRIIGRKHAVLILSLMANKTGIRFGEIREKLTSISPSTLSQRLDELEEAAFIRREIFPEIPPRVEYSLTKSGDKLVKTLKSLVP